MMLCRGCKSVGTTSWMPQPISHGLASRMASSTRSPLPTTFHQTVRRSRGETDGRGREGRRGGEGRRGEERGGEGRGEGREDGGGGVGCSFACAHACIRACVRACMCVYVRACARADALRVSGRHKHKHRHRRTQAHTHGRTGQTIRHRHRHRHWHRHRHSTVVGHTTHRLDAVRRVSQVHVLAAQVAVAHSLHHPAQAGWH
jgi:hypothetical protein